MHKALQILEAEARIFHFTCTPEVTGEEPDWPCIPASCPKPRYSTSSLLNLALTCRAFKDVALDMLWSHMVDLRPLFSLITGKQTLHESEFITEPITKANCDAFMSYANRIKLLCLGHAGNHTVPIASFIQVSRATGYNCILPSLHYLHVACGGPEVHFCASPKLGHVIVSTHWQQDVSLDIRLEATNNIQAFIHALPFTSPNVSVLDNDCYLSDISLKYIARLRRLKSLEMFNVTGPDWGQLLTIGSDFFQHLSTLPHLNRLNMYGSVNFPLEWAYFQPLYNFSHLEYLRLDSEVDTISQVATLMLMSKFPVLRHLIVCQTNLPPELESPHALPYCHWPRFFKGLAQATRREVFDALYIHTEVTGPGSEKVSTPMTLLATPDMVDLDLLELSMPCLNVMSVENISSITQAWPSLTYLELDSYSTRAEGSFLVLVKIASELPNLDYLFISSISLHELPPDSDVPILDHDLAQLDWNMDTCLHCSPTQFITYIDRLFPHLDVPCCGLDISYATDPRVQLGWGDLEDTLVSFQLARREQKVRDVEQIEAGHPFYW